MQKSHPFDFGLIGLGVMGRNFILNVAGKGFRSLGYDLDPGQVAQLKSEGDEDQVDATTDLADFVAGLKRPRKIMMLVPAGAPVDAVIESLLPLLEAGDIIVDGGNSFFEDTDRREDYLRGKGIHFFGTGVSGGAEGARRGPSIMPGGSHEAYEELRPVFEAAAARYKGEPCVAYMGPKSAGNYVKMVHNGIEYALMQLIAEVYDLLHRGAGMDNGELQALFTRWNRGRLQSFLVEISADIFGTADPLGPGELLDKILDQAKQKGTGKWTSQNALDLGIPVPTIDMAVSMRQLSSLKAQRQEAEKRYRSAAPEPVQVEPAQAENALYLGFVMAYAQGMHLLAEASREYGYGLQLSEIAKIWRAGCIIRADMLADITEAYKSNPDLPNLLLDATFAGKVSACLPDTRKLLGAAVAAGFPAPALTSALSYLEAYASGRLPLNLVQAQRDYFGSHTYQRTDRDGTFHTEWQAD